MSPSRDERAALAAAARALRETAPGFWSYRRLAAHFGVGEMLLYNAVNPPKAGTQRAGKAERAAKQRASVAARKARARALHAAGLPVAVIAQRTGISEHTVKRDLGINPRRAPEPPAGPDRRLLAIADTRDLTQRFFGDPLPGESALDRKRAEAGA